MAARPRAVKGISRVKQRFPDVGIIDSVKNKEKVEEFLKISMRDDPLEVKQVKGENLQIEDRTNPIIKEFWETYKKDSQVNLGLAIGGVAGGLIFWLAGLAVASAGLYYGVNPKPPPTGGGGNRLGEDAGGLRSLEPRSHGANALAGGEGAMTDDEIEEKMQRLVTSKGVLAKGLVPQEALWRNLADRADTMRIEDQNLTLIFVQQGSVDLPGTSEFFWLDPSEAKERYEALRAAHKRSGKFSDVYLEAGKIRYDDQPVPMFHVASLIQYALRLIQRDSLSRASGATRPA